jgi:cell division protein FtsA
MQNDKPILFVEINETNYIFAAGVYDEDRNLKVVEKIIITNKEISKNKFKNFEDASNIIKQNVEQIENKLNYIFKDLTLIIENFDHTCINISGSKKLNGSQVLKENISYILNSLKSSIAENEKQKSILHIFNTKSILDGNSTDNLPIGLFGDFYNHELTFFLIANNDLRNIKQIFSKNNLEVKKILLKSFNEGTQLIKQKKVETFFKIKIGRKNSSISFFDQSAFQYSENLNFGTDIILKDISKICSLENEVILNILQDNILHSEDINKNEFLKEKYFTNRSYRKIRKKLIKDIARARIEEIANIIFNQNINIKILKQTDYKIYLTILDKIVLNNFGKSFELFFSNEKGLVPELIDSFEVNSAISNAADLSIHGWKKEAIPIIQRKNSLITRIFKSIFG